MSAGNTERRRRIREQLREFYGDPTASRERHPVDSGKSAIPPEMDLDSEFFNVSKYVTDLLRRESLKELVETDTQLLRNVRQLDGELQELVYRNYAKFISATDTIREMRDNITEMDSKLQALSSNVENIDKLSKSITDKLQSHRSRIEEMVLNNRMLRKVQFLVELADTMRRLIERQEYSTCVRYWIVGDNFLAKHMNLSRITKIRADCMVLAEQLYKKLQETVVTTSLDGPEAMDFIRCVVEDMRLMRATSLFANGAVKGTSTTAVADCSSPASFETEILNTLMKNVSGGFADGIQRVNGAIRAALAVPDFASMDRTRWAEVMENARLQEALAQLKSLCALFHSNSERVYTLFHREGDATVSLRIVEEVQPVLIDIMSPITAQFSELLIAVIDAFCSDGEGALANPSTVKSGLSAMFTTLAKRLKYYSGTLKTLGVNYLDNAHSQQSRQYAALVDQSVLEIFQRFLGALEAKLTEGINVPDTIRSNVTAKDPAYQKPLQFCMTRFLFAHAANAADLDGITSLIDTETLKQTDVAGLQRQCSCVMRAFLHRGIVLLGQLHLQWVAAASCPADAVDPTSTAAVNFGVSRSLYEFVGQLGNIYTLLRRGILSVNAAAGEAVKERRSMDGATGSSRLYMSTGSGRSSGMAASRKLVVTFARQTDNALQLSVDRIFSKESQRNAELRTFPREIRPSSIVAAVTVYVLKGMIEYVRKQTFTRTGFQCVQITCTFLLHALTPFVPPASPGATTAGSDKCASPLSGEWLCECKDDSMLKSVPQLLNECCTCAYERCREKAPLTSVVVDKLVKSAIENMRGPSPPP
ncbi:hypothetical protein TCDM_04655 [Trypanosoma cruzi Dm28c]|uniref:Vacuolar protein sorting-associated protein 51 homolog n=1 Tax=Trypanosoma cruzi Dm28c TaxID=1416333 RepID=V5BKM5_TRYCR|nr:hypothetical protein TCDM_04655 [Trypanosoma cruzi Dm28c]